MFAVSRNSWSS